MTWLIASLGISPSVITEAIWHLEVEKQLPVDRLTCVGTQSSWKRAQQDLFAPGGAFERLRTHLGKPDRWLTEGNGFLPVIAEAADNRDLEEAKAMDRAFRCAIREAQEDEIHDGAVVACISGGRKTMSSSLQQAMALLARPEDWAFHVLLDLPAGIRENDVNHSGFGFPGDPEHPELGEVGVDAFEVPLVRLRDFAASRHIDLSDESLVQNLQKAVDEAQVLPRLILELRTLTLRCQARPGWELRLPPQQALLLAAFANGNKPMTLEEAEPFLRQIVDLWRTLQMDEGTRAFPTEFGKLEEAIARWLGNDPEYFNQQKSRLKKELEKADPSFHMFTLRAHGREGVKGFAEHAYGHNPPLIQVAL